MQEQKNPLLCDPENGLCEMPGVAGSTNLPNTTTSAQKAVKIIYFTDPICSSCWGIEPQLRKLKLEYGHLVEIEYRMGGLLPDWSYNSGGISKPSDVAGHWDHVSRYYDMPIDGDVWLEDPLHSSYPPSIAFKAAHMQDPEKAILFLREIREMVFLEKKNICKWEHLEQAAKRVGLNVLTFKNDYEGKAKDVFNEDLKLGRTMGVRGFPSMFFSNQQGSQQFVYGSQAYQVFEQALLKVYPEATKNTYDHSWTGVFNAFQSLSAKEFSELTGTERNKSVTILDELSREGKLEKRSCKNGAVWIRKNTGTGQRN